MLEEHKRAQVAETTTWIVATIIIIVMLMMFILGASLLIKVKNLDVSAKKLFVSDDYLKKDSFLNTNTALAYIISKNKAAVEKWADDNKIDLDDYVK